MVLLFFICICYVSFATESGPSTNFPAINQICFQNRIIRFHQRKQFLGDFRYRLVCARYTGVCLKVLQECWPLIFKINTHPYFQCLNGSYPSPQIRGVPYIHQVGFPHNPTPPPFWQNGKKPFGCSCFDTGPARSKWETTTTCNPS